MSAAPSQVAFADLFDPAFLQRVEALSLRVRSAQRGGRLADQRTSARGQGSDFADYKTYAPGDDLRAMDWNIFRRLGKTFVRVFDERQDLPVYILQDVSQSMYVESTSRAQAALRTSLALSAIALGQHDSVSLLPFSNAMQMRMRRVTGRSGIAPVARSLAALMPEGSTGLAQAIESVAAMQLRRGLVIIVSDFFDDGGISAVVKALSRLPHRILLARVMRASDADPSLDKGFDGDIRVDDGEGNAAEITVSPQILERYRSAYRAFDLAISTYASTYGAGLVSIDADQDVIDQLVPLLGSQGIVL